MKAKQTEDSVPNYSVATLRVSYIGLAGQFSNIVVSVPLTLPSGRKINHAVSNLPDGTIRGPHLSLAEVIDRFTKGELGSTEVPANQIW